MPTRKRKPKGPSVWVVETPDHAPIDGASFSDPMRARQMMNYYGTPNEGFRVRRYVPAKEKRK